MELVRNGKANAGVAREIDLVYGLITRAFSRGIVSGLSHAARFELP